MIAGKYVIIATRSGDAGSITLTPFSRSRSGQAE